MQEHLTAIAAVAVLVLAGGHSSAEAQVRDTTLLRPTDVRLTVSNDPLLSGVYTASGISRVCGKMDLGYPHRANAFTVEFPDDEPNLEVSSISFDADTLPIGATIHSFQLGVNISTPKVGKPPKFVVRANEPQYQEPGSATLTATGGTATLNIDGIATSGTKVRLVLTIVCHPRP